jgi:hypothetical protein
VVPGAFTKLQLLVPDETAAPGSASGKIGTPLMEGVGIPFSVRVNAVDALWNVINTNDTVRLTSSDTGATLPANAALINGTRTFNVTLNTAGSRTVAAWNVTHPTITSNVSPAITVSTNPFVKLQILMPGETNAPGTPSGKTGTPIAHTAGSAFNVVVNAVDTNWNIVNTVTDTIQITSSDTDAVLPANNTLNSGTRTFSVTLHTSGNRTVTATDLAHEDVPAVTGAGVLVNPAAASKLAIATQPSTNASIGVPFAQQPVIQIQDQYNNVRSNDAALVRAARSAGVGNLLGTTNITSVGGIAAFTNLAHSTNSNITIQFTSTGLEQHLGHLGQRPHRGQHPGDYGAERVCGSPGALQVLPAGSGDGVEQSAIELRHVQSTVVPDQPGHLLRLPLRFGRSALVHDFGAGVWPDWHGHQHHLHQ